MRNIMNDSDGMPHVGRIVERLRSVGGIAGVVLGGSRARGTNNPDSDYDIGVYYDDCMALDLPALAKAAEALDDEHRGDLIAPPGGWGNWVNGGGWLMVEGRRVDFILRDFGRVEQAVVDCLSGIVHAHYQTGHPHAYINVMYAGELAIARLLYDPENRLRTLKEKATPYPAALRKAIVHLFDFETGFSQLLAATYAESGDNYYVAAHVARSLSCLNQVLFALNGEYCLNEKKAVQMIDGFRLKPRGYRLRVDGIVARTGNDNGAACRELEALILETRRLAEEDASRAGVTP